MEQMLQQNRRLKEIMKRCQEEIMELKKIGTDHQNQIDSLLKFNQRLLTIIENQMPNKMLNRSGSGSNLDRIQEINEKDQEIVQPHFQTASIKNKIQHLNQKQVQNLKDQKTNLTHHRQPENSQVVGGQGVNRSQFKASQGYDNNNIFGNQTARSSQFPQGVIIQKQSLIEMPSKYFQLSKGLNDHYKKDLFSSIEQLKMPSKNLKQQKKQSFSSQPEQMEPIHQQEVGQLQQIKDLIKQYQQQFIDNADEYQHICSLIKNDLKSDLKQFRQMSSQSTNFYNTKIRDLQKLKGKIAEFDPIVQLVQIIKKLNIPRITQNMLYDRVISRQGK